MDIFIFSVLTCVSLVPAFAVIAKRIGLVDMPSDRKRHEAPTPVVGGVCVFLAFCITVFLFPGSSVSLSMVGWLALVLILGVVDDYSDISHRIRLLGHAIVVLGIIMTEGLYVTNIGAITGTGQGQIHSSYLAAGFTIIGVLGAINAINMSDGIDGLLGCLLLISLSVVLVLTWNEQAGVFSQVEILAIIGALVGFVLCNSRLLLKRGILFLGDAGSTTIGFLLVYLLISHTQGNTQTFSPVLAGWLVGLPLLDASAVIAIRTMKGNSPFSADRTHIHYNLVDSGFSTNATVAILCAIHIGMILFAVTISSTASNQADAVLFWSFIALVVVRMALMKRQPDNIKSVDASSASSDCSNLPSVVNVIGADSQVPSELNLSAGEITSPSKDNPERIDAISDVSKNRQVQSESIT